MNPDVLRGLMRRLDRLEREAVRYRAGEITATAPLSVALGSAATSYEDVRAIQPSAALGEQVATLVFGNDLLVLGELTSEPSGLGGAFAFFNG